MLLLRVGERVDAPAPMLFALRLAGVADGGDVSDDLVVGGREVGLGG